MQTRIYPFAMRYGIYIGLLIILNFVLSSTSSGILSMLSWGVWGVTMYLLYYFAMKFKIQEAQNMFMTYGQSFQLVFLMYIFGALVATALRIVYLKWLNPDVLTQIYDQSMLVLEQLKMPDKSQIRDAMASFLKPVNYSFMFLWIDMISGLIYALVIAAIVSKKEVMNVEGPTIDMSKKDEDEI